MTRQVRRIILAVALVLTIEVGFWYREFLFSLFVRPPAPRAPYDRSGWAVKVDAPPLENFYRVTPELYRGAQPDAAGMRKLKELGIKTVVNLRLMHSDADEIRGLDIATEHIRIDTLKPETDEVVRFLRIAADPNRAPVFVHCMRGVDRTGLAVAAYRIVVCGWTKAKAEDEMINGPFGHDGLFPNIQAFLEKLDVEDLRRRIREDGKAK